MRLFTSTRPICKQIEAFESQLLEMSRQPAAAMSEFSRITQAPETMGGKPCIRGMRITVSMVVGQIGAGRTIDEVLADYPALEREDVLEALRFAASLA